MTDVNKSGSTSQTMYSDGLDGARERLTDPENSIEPDFASQQLSQQLTDKQN